MLKTEYQYLIENKPWQETEKHFNSLPRAKVTPITNLDIDTAQWIDFTVEHFDDAQQKWEEPKSHYTDKSNELAELNNKLGRNKHNTFELNYGMNGDTNMILKEMLGTRNIEKLGADADSILMRLIVKFPGHGVAWHYDDAGSYRKKFPEADTSKLRRLWFSLDEWKDGHAMQISKTVLTNYKKGDVYDIPFGLGHASSNFGYCPQYTISFTGIIND
tara:strand:+ start:280 stop:930 length:651 start_codon:yes stop_codon:yes gene_type:complete